MGHGENIKEYRVYFRETDTGTIKKNVMRCEQKIIQNRKIKLKQTLFHLKEKIRGQSGKTVN